MIYIDPPYNTGNDFVYEDDFKDPMARYKEVTNQTTKSNPETTTPVMDVSDENNLAVDTD